MLKVLAIMVLCCFGCGTLLNGGTGKVRVTSSAPGSVYVDGAKRGQTPITVELDAKKSHRIAVKTRDGREGSCALTSAAGGGWIILDILFGLLPLLVDAVTGGWSSLDKNACHIKVH